MGDFSSTKERTLLKPNLDLIGIIMIMNSVKKKNLSNIAGHKFDGKA